MALEVTHAEHAGGAPGVVVVRVHGHAATATSAPALLVRDGTELTRIPPRAGRLVVAPGPFALDYAVPLHVALQAGDWYLEPLGGPPQASPAVEDLKARLAELTGEVAEVRKRLDRPQARHAARRRRRRVGVLPALLVATGSLALADAIATVVWQEPVSALYALNEQHELDGELEQVETRLATKAPPRAVPPAQRMRTLARELNTATQPGDAIGRLEIPRLNQRHVIVQGSGERALRRGPGHYAQTPMPGEGGTVGIAGHRTTYGAPFRDVDDLRRGDAIDLVMPYGRFRYRVEGTTVVDPDDVSVLRKVGSERLALTACHPLYSAAQRIIVHARLERSEPRGAARPEPSGNPA